MKDEDEDDEVLAAGTTVGEYSIESLLGRGGMGEVYGAHHPVIGKRVAIKVMNRHCSSNPTNVERFVHEAKAVNAIGHSNIVDIFSFGRTADDRCYFVMEWLQGESLRARLARGPVEPAHAYDILENVLRALEAAHAASIVHRDLKPDNIFLVAPKGDGEPERVKLLDFGIAKLSGHRVGPKSSITQTGTVMGTPTHMSPEQATGGAIGPATDIYALGVVAFEMATGHLPFDAESSVQLMAKHVDHQPPKPSSLGPVSAGFERLILDMLEKKPDARPGAREIRERIGKLRGEPTPTQATGERVLVPSRETAPTVAVRRSDPAIEIGKTVAAATTPRPGDTVRNTTGDTTIDPPARRRPFALIGAAAVAVIGVALFFVLRGGDHAAERTPSIAPATAQPAEAPHPAPPVEAPQPAPAEPQPPAVVAQPAPSEPAKPPVTAKKPPHASHRPVPPAPAQGSAAVTPPVVAAPAQGSAAAPPPPHDVDAVRDPFASGGSK